MFESFLGVNPWTALFVLLNTLTIFFVARKYLFDPVTKLIQERQQEIDDMYTQAATAKEQARLLQDAYAQRLSDAQATGERLVKEAVARGQARQEEILRQVNAEADAIRQKAAADVAREKEKAINDAKNEIADIAIVIAAKVVGSSLNVSQQAGLVDRFIDELGESL